MNSDHLTRTQRQAARVMYDKGWLKYHELAHTYDMWGSDYSGVVIARYLDRFKPRRPSTRYRKSLLIKHYYNPNWTGLAHWMEEHKPPVVWGDLPSTAIYLNWEGNDE